MLKGAPTVAIDFIQAFPAGRSDGYDDGVL
jgi:hypothetical protein